MHRADGNRFTRNTLAARRPDDPARRDRAQSTGQMSGRAVKNLSGQNHLRLGQNQRYQTNAQKPLRQRDARNVAPVPALDPAVEGNISQLERNKTVAKKFEQKTEMKLAALRPLMRAAAAPAAAHAAAKPNAKRITVAEAVKRLNTAQAQLSSLAGHKNCSVADRDACLELSNQCAVLARNLSARAHPGPQTAAAPVIHDLDRGTDESQGPPDRARLDDDLLSLSEAINVVPQEDSSVEGTSSAEDDENDANVEGSHPTEFSSLQIELEEDDGVDYDQESELEAEQNKAALPPVLIAVPPAAVVPSPPLDAPPPPAAVVPPAPLDAPPPPAAVVPPPLDAPPPLPPAAVVPQAPLDAPPPLPTSSAPPNRPPPPVPTAVVPAAVVPLVVPADAILAEPLAPPPPVPQPPVQIASAPPAPPPPPPTAQKPAAPSSSASVAVAPVKTDPSPPAGQSDLFAQINAGGIKLKALKAADPNAAENAVDEADKPPETVNDLLVQAMDRMNLALADPDTNSHGNDVVRGDEEWED